ncbi:MAG TPA: glycosyltransferase family 39 protein [Vicinamibacterales bacterium]|nr:glycosyltransferase family 39 protein [Vicinamibacterales bacterium]
MTRSVRAACLLSLSIGLLFLFVRAPHPWGWNGFDHYHELALALASGQPFPTMEVPWGYAYFLAAFYRLFGDHPWIPLLVQVSLNALTPMLLFALAIRWTDRRTAAIAALLLGALSFNTVYASTQSSDAVCTVLFLTAVLLFMKALERDRLTLFALTGLLTGVIAQFRPNLILIPAVLALYAIWKRRVRRSVAAAAILLAAAGAALTPWMVRNYKLTGTLLPTSVHGGAQLWYGTLQVGPYLDSRGYNPRSVFEAPAFEYTSLDHVPIRISGGVGTCALDDRHGSLSLFYWTDFDPSRHQVKPETVSNGRFVFELPAPLESPATYYYYFEVTWPGETGVTTIDTPPGGAATPLVYFVSQDHLGDLDRFHDLLDVFDVVRLARHDAWSEPLPAADLLRRAGAVDVRTAVQWLLGGDDQPLSVDVDHDDHTARITIGGDSTITIPREWDEKLTDLTFIGRHAEAVMYAHRSLAALSHATPVLDRNDVQCALVDEVKINDVFYREQPHAMRRYSALAFDNIRRSPAAFLEASLYRVYRVFVVVGSKDKWTNQQFRGAAAIYAAATAASLTFLGLFIAGVIVLWRQRADIVLPLLLILYVPATIAPLLTNMRYSVTVQPLMFVFVAAALTSAIRGRAGTRTAPRT